MFDHEMKGAAYAGQNSALNAQINQGNAVSPPQPSVGQALTHKLDQIQGALVEIRNRQKSLLMRLHGERPEKECPQTTQGLGGNGVLGEIDVRLNVVASIIKEIIEQQSTLDRLA